MTDSAPWTFPWPAERIARYSAPRVTTPPSLDDTLGDGCWARAPFSPAFADLVTGAPAALDTRAAILWDDEHLYVGYRVEEPDVRATMTERDSEVWRENDIELFIGGPDAYYELEVNPLGTVYEVLFTWADATATGPGAAARAAVPELDPAHPLARPWDGVGFAHPRGHRTGFWGFDLPGLRTAVHVDGAINDSSTVDRGWTVEVAIPWASLDVLGLPARPGAGYTLRMDLSRFNDVTHGDGDSGGWAWSPHGVWDSHVPELFTIVELVADEV